LPLEILDSGCWSLSTKMYLTNPINPSLYVAKYPRHAYLQQVRYFQISNFSDDSTHSLGSSAKVILRSIIFHPTSIIHRIWHPQRHSEQNDHSLCCASATPLTTWPFVKLPVAFPSVVTWLSRHFNHEYARDRHEAIRHEECSTVEYFVRS
jgi:hypothetical protein